MAALAEARRADRRPWRRPPGACTVADEPASQAAVDWLIDNRAAYDSVLAAIGSARHSIWMTQLAFDADCQAYGPGGEGRAIVEALIAAAARAPIDIRIILNETFLLDTARPLRRFFAQRLERIGAAPGKIEVRGISSFPRLLHAKLVIVDGREAFLLGSPFVNGYWDDERHQPVDPRRPLRELGGRPLHDLSMRVTGPPVAALARLFTDTGRRTSPSNSAPSEPRPVQVVIHCAARRPQQPAGRRHGDPQALLDGLARAPIPDLRRAPVP